MENKSLTSIKKRRKQLGLNFKFWAITMVNDQCRYSIELLVKCVHSIRPYLRHDWEWCPDDFTQIFNVGSLLGYLVKFSFPGVGWLHQLKYMPNKKQNSKSQFKQVRLRAKSPRIHSPVSILLYVYKPLCLEPWAIKQKHISCGPYTPNLDLLNRERA